MPLGGRHVEHFWKLLDNLQIPYATLLDLDLGRKTGGISRIKEVAKKCKEIEPLSFFEGLDEVREISDLDNIGDKNFNIDEFEFVGDMIGDMLIKNFRKLGLYFIYPLDIDFTMLHKFKDYYCKVNKNGRAPEFSEERKKTTLKKNGKPELYSKNWNDEFAWYPYLFLNKSKPDTHIMAISRIPDETVAKNMPEEISELFDLIEKHLDQGT